VLDLTGLCNCNIWRPVSTFIDFFNICRTVGNNIEEHQCVQISGLLRARQQDNFASMKIHDLKRKQRG
jgi:hypothetical protein